MSQEVIPGFKEYDLLLDLRPVANVVEFRGRRGHGTQPWAGTSHQVGAWLPAARPVGVLVALAPHGRGSAPALGGERHVAPKEQALPTSRETVGSRPKTVIRADD